MLQGNLHFLGGLEASVRGRREGLSDDGFELARVVLAELAGERIRALYDLSERAGAGAEWPMTRARHIQNAAHGIDVGAPIELCTAHLLRRNIGKFALYFARLSACMELQTSFGDAEIAQLGMPIQGHQ